MRLPILLFIYVMLSLTSACVDQGESPTDIPDDLRKIVVWVQCDLEETIDPYVSSRDGFTEDRGDLILIKTSRTFIDNIGESFVSSRLAGYWISKNYLLSTSLLPKDKFRFRSDELHIVGSPDPQDSNEYQLLFSSLSSEYDFRDTLNLDGTLDEYFHLNREDLSLDRGHLEREQVSTCEVIEESVALNLFHEYGSKLDLLFQQRDDEKIRGELNKRI